MIYSWEIEPDPFRAKLLKEIWTLEGALSGKKYVLSMTDPDLPNYSILQEDVSKIEVRLDSLKNCLANLNSIK